MLDTKTVAAIYGISLCRVNQIAADRGIAPKKIGGIHLWSVAQCKQIKPKPNGRPPYKKAKR